MSEVSVYKSLNGRPEENLRKVLELAGGIERFIGSDDVVVIKPNVQWWNQGAPNIAATGALVRLIMERPNGFSGEVVLAENYYRGATPWLHAGLLLKEIVAEMVANLKGFGL